MKAIRNPKNEEKLILQNKNKYPSVISERELKIYYARAMDSIKHSEIIEDDRLINDALKQKGFSLINPYEKQNIPIQKAGGLIENNFALLKESDVLIANLTKKDYQYIGAIFEIAQAVNLGIPTMVCIGNSNLENRYYLQFYSDFICNTIDEAITYIWRCLSLEGINHQLKEEKTFYDHIAVNYETLSRKTYQDKDADIDRYEKEREQLKEKLRYYCHDKTVLELGCGTGDWTKFIAEVSKSVVCIDASQNMIKRAKERFTDSTIQPYFIQGDFLDETLHIEPCDIVVSYFALSFLPPPIQINLLSNMKKWVKKDGCCLFGESMKFALLPSIGLGCRKIQRRTIDKKEYFLYKEYFSPDQLQKLLVLNGFRVIDLPSDVRWFTFCAVQFS